MDCPVCKYPNAPGVTHCGMCHEVFNRSAAQAYLHAVKRERRTTEDNPPEEDAVITTQHVVEEVKAVAAVIDWDGIGKKALDLFKLIQKPLAIVAGLAGVWIVLSFIFDTNVWYHLLGRKLVYSYSGKGPAAYLIGFKTNAKMWSERQGNLDTPMDRSKVDEIGTVYFEKLKPESKKSNLVVLAHVKEWIHISDDDANGSMSRTISHKHPSLADARLILNRKGTVLERRYALSPRLAKSMPFMAPRFSTGRMRQGREWTEEVEWLDVFDDWQIKWTGVLHWKMGELTECRQSTCAKMIYTANLEPHLRGGPDWARGAIRRLSSTTRGVGEAFFDVSHDILISNDFSYEGTVRLPIDNLARIPMELRIGHRVSGPGAIVIHFENKIAISKN